MTVLDLKIIFEIYFLLFWDFLQNEEITQAPTMLILWDLLTCIETSLSGNFQFLRKASFLRLKTVN
jgi:hypothetical protein